MHRLWSYLLTCSQWIWRRWVHYKAEENLHGFVQSAAWREWRELSAARSSLLLLWLPHVSHGSSMFHSLCTVCASSYLLCFPTPLTTAFLSQSFSKAWIILTVICSHFPMFNCSQLYFNCFFSCFRMKLLTLIYPHFFSFVLQVQK